MHSFESAQWLKSVKLSIEANAMPAVCWRLVAAFSSVAYVGNSRDAQEEAAWSRALEALVCNGPYL